MWILDTPFNALSKCLIVNNQLIIIMHYMYTPKSVVVRFLNLETGEILESPTIRCRPTGSSIDYYNNELFFFGGYQQKSFADK